MLGYPGPPPLAGTPPPSPLLPWAFGYYNPVGSRTATGGGGLRSAIYRTLLQFYRNFSVIPPFAVTRHTVRVSPLLCMKISKCIHGPL